jgi:AmmeMemoRadiSam system protein B/AmmeMemoRadiSam system protein A
MRTKTKKFVGTTENFFRKLSNVLILILVLFLAVECNSQEKHENEMKLVDRQPAVAGQFYPSDSLELYKTIENMFKNAVQQTIKNEVLAIIAPHAGYVFSGEVAATCFNQIDITKEYENIFILAPSHKAIVEGAAVYDIGNFKTPLGTVKVNIELAKKLIKENQYFLSRPDVHTNEHSIEVELPFLQYIMKKDFKIVPIIIGTQDLQICKKIASSLRPWLNDKNLFIISSDFSHYPTYDDALKIDKNSGDAICSNSINKLIEVLNKNQVSNTPKLATSMCGLSGILTLLFMTEKMADVNYNEIQYKNSGDAPLGDKDQVVGYWAISLTITKKSEFNLTDKDKKELLKIARETIELYVKERKSKELDISGFSETLKTNCGAFVTLHKNGNLRGCIGNFSQNIPLYQIVQEMSIAAAVSDYRFSKVTEDELKKIEVEISVLTPLQKINSIDEIVLGKHGIYMKKGAKTGTFLPQVADETSWTKEQFLSHCSSEKAGIGLDGWKTADLYIYEALVFKESEFKK